MCIVKFAWSVQYLSLFLDIESSPTYFNFLFHLASIFSFYEEVKRPMIARHPARSPAASSRAPAATRSPQMQSCHLFIGLPLGCRPGAYTSPMRNNGSSSLLYTCPNQPVFSCAQLATHLLDDISSGYPH